MKKNNIIYWVTTGIICLMMLFTAYMDFTSPDVAEVYRHFGLADWLRTEIATAKIIGALVLLMPQISVRWKEWAYAGMAILFISAAYGHYSSNDPAGNIIAPFVTLAILLVSNVYLHKVRGGIA